MKAVVLTMVLMLPLAGMAAERFKPVEQAENESLDQNRGAWALTWKDPVYPPELKATAGPASVLVRFIVDESGVVTAPEALEGDERFFPAALAAIRDWKYRPELRKGQPVPVSRDVTLLFSPNGPPKGISKLFPPYDDHPSPFVHAVRLSVPDPVYPPWLEQRRLVGQIEMNLSLDEQGRVDGVKVVAATNPDFLEAALATIATWKFQPACFGRIPARDEQEAVLGFSVFDEETGQETRVDWLERNGIYLREPANTKTQDYFDVSPRVAVMVDPVYPYELLRSRTPGGARVNFTVSLRGEVTNVSVDEATAPEFGASLAAAIAAWQFVPLRRHGEETGADFSITWKFAEPRPLSVEQRLLATFDHGEKPMNARLLDRPLQLLYARPPVYPAGFIDTQTSGEADIEVIVDRDGRVRCPRIVAATKEEFGWAAATAASQWFFETPLKGGVPVDTRAVIPVAFKPE